MTDILTTEELRLLADIGFISASRGMFEHATAIFEAICELRPEQEAGFLGRGMVDILGADPAAAIIKLKAAPLTHGVQTFLGIALIQVGDVAEGKSHLEEVCRVAGATPFGRIAEETLQIQVSG